MELVSNEINLVNKLLNWSQLNLIFHEIRSMNDKLLFVIWNAFKCQSLILQVLVCLVKVNIWLSVYDYRVA